MRQLRGTNLKRFLRDYRRAHPPLHDIAILLQNVEYPTNVGSIFRIADGCGAKELILSGITPAPPNPTIAKVARGKMRRVSWRSVEGPEEAVAALKADGYRICALELTDNAVPHAEYDYPDKICLIAGHEDHGIPGHTLRLCDEAVFVPMYGKGLSLNVAMSLAVVCFHIRALALGSASDASPPD